MLHKTKNNWVHLLFDLDPGNIQQGNLKSISLSKNYDSYKIKHREQRTNVGKYTLVNGLFMDSKFFAYEYLSISKLRGLFVK